jgi:type II secretion system protein C
MRHPLWILNNALLCLVIGVLIFVLLSRQQVPERESIEPSTHATELKKETSKINISKIYENDLFDTYQKEILKPRESLVIAQIPEPPKPIPVEVPPPPKPQFLDPLQIMLKGIMATSDDAHNVAIIFDNKTKREIPYKVGEKIEDAQLIRVFKNKIIFLRSNGQQEVFYLRQQDAQQDPTFAKMSDWKDTIKKIAPNNYQLSLSNFIAKVSSLAQFIDLLDVTTVYQHGISKGLHIGTTDNNLAESLGLKTGDIILDINDIQPNDTSQRMAIYKQMINLNPGDQIKVTLQRDGQLFILNYTATEFAQNKKEPAIPLAAGTVSEQTLHEEQHKILEKKHTFAPTLQEIRQQERKNMLQRGGAPLVETPRNNTD